MKPYHKIIIRIPQFSLTTTLSEAWSPLLESIKYSSPAFYEQVKNLKFEDLGNQTLQLQKTIYKYFNRAKYRCPPLGTFSSIGVIETRPLETSALVIHEERKLHIFEDWLLTANINRAVTGDIAPNLKLFANSTYYRVEDSIRYVKRAGEKFELSEIAYLPTVIEILELLQAPITYESLIARNEDYARYVIPMIQSELILTEKEPNLIGTDYFKRTGIKGEPESKKYLISEVSMEQPYLSEHTLRHIPSLIKLLKSGLQSNFVNGNITDFINNFSKRFDRQDVPLMTALDPEIGVKYGDFHNHHISSIVSAMLIDKPEDENQFATFLKNAFDKPLLNTTIRLDELINDLPQTSNELQLPNSMSMICRVNDGNIYVERIGGNSFTQLSGRFSLASNEIYSLCKEIASIEESSNPGVLFFDISYNAEGATDNVNRRREIYPYELNLLNYPGSQEPLSLQDIIVSVSGNRIILRSKKFGKRLIPRMASAYNYRRSKLPIFRFLYDISFYGLIPDLSFDISDIIKGKKYYPKVQFRNIVLSLPKLRVLKSDLKPQTGLSSESRLLQYLSEFQIGSVVRLSKGEENAVYDLNSKLQLKLLVEEIIKTGEVFLEEFLSPQAPLVVNHQGLPYNNQLVIPLIHQNEVYHESSPSDPKYHQQRFFLPLDQWLYFEVYSFSTRADDILLKLHQLTIQFADHITKWFFMRYNENGAHIRFRVLLKDNVHTQFIEQLQYKLKPMVLSGTISDIAIRSYQREMERYGVADIEKVESHFHLDSECVIQQIKEGLTDLDKYNHCIRLFNLIKSYDIIGEPRYEKWILNIKEIFESEHHLGITQFKEVKKYFQKHRNEILLSIDNFSASEIQLSKSICSIINACPERRKAPMFTDLMHMHINRLFNDFQRTHELIIYSILTDVQKIMKYKVKIQDQ
jgi:thiopeptide-type bacteriocin biosynthesis protein